MRVYLSPSNQTHNLYAGQNTNEQDQCHRIGEHCAAALRRNGVEVRLAAKGAPLFGRVQESNAWPADLHVPIHTNAGGGHGVEVLTSVTGANNRFALSILAGLARIVPSGRNRGIKPRTPSCAGGWEIYAANAPVPYIEVEFHDNRAYAAWIVANVHLIGETIARSIVEAAGRVFVPVAAPAPSAPPAVVQAGFEFKPGVALTSGAQTFVFQGDGNAVLSTDGRPTWATMTVGPERRLVFQGDGNLVLYHGATPLAHTGTHGNPGARLALQHDGNLVIVDAGGRPVWALFGVAGARQFARRL